MTRGLESRHPGTRAPASLQLRALALLACLLIPPAASWCEDDAGPDEAMLREAVRLRAGGLADLAEGRFDRAAERFEALAEILPDNVLPPVNLAITQFALGRPGEALRQADRALGLRPGHTGALFAVAWGLRFEPAADERWHEVIGRFEKAAPRDPRPPYLRALHLRELHPETEPAVIFEALREASNRDPRNLRLLLMTLEAALAAGGAADASDALDGIEDRLAGFPERIADHAAELRQLLAADLFAGFGADESQVDLEKAKPRAAVLHNLLRGHDVYALGSQRLVGGVGGETFAQQDFDPPLPKSIQGGADLDIAFVHLGAVPVAGSHLAPARRRGRDTLLLVGPRSLLEVDGLDTVTRLDPLPGLSAGSWDATGDGETDLVFVDDGVHLISSWLGEAPARPQRIASYEGTGISWPLDVDHDGDLDIFLTGGGGSRYLRNDGGTWTDLSGEMGLVGTAAGAVGDLESADFDDDGDLDVVMVRGGRLVFLENRRAGELVAATEAAGLAQPFPDGAVGEIEIADFDGDGRMDLFAWSRDGTALLRRTDTGFTPHAGWAVDGGWHAAVAGDFDNDGDVDLVARTGAGLRLARNRSGRFEAESLGTEGDPSEVAFRVRELRTADLDQDGDLDLAALDEQGRLHRWRNDGGNVNHWLRLSLIGREHNNSKNNTQGLFARVEVSARGHFQATTNQSGMVHLGLGAHRQADVLRVVWPNGLAQFWQQVAADQSLVEEQVLKGSCPFLYTWNGDEFIFVTDLMWRSPLGMVMADGRAAPHQSARDAVLLPRGSLAPAGDELWLSVTEELWEAAYVDEQVLYAVDHPADVELVVDERILPPPYPQELPLHWLPTERQAAPSAATLRTADEARDVLAELRRRDEVYVGDLPLTRYQGLTRGQTLDVRFEDVEARSPLRLALWGWTFPTDTSINVALAADPRLDPQGPSLEARVGGTWRQVSPFVGFPAGKRKGMVVELPDGVVQPDGSVELRWTTNLQIYWDAVRLAAAAEPERRITPLRPLRADLHPRGYSRLFRSSPDGPHLFDYGEVDAAPRFRPMTGQYTRFGEVSPLLAASDSEYVVMAVGDEMTVVYGASTLPPLPPGWVRDWVLYTDGWVKDADVNTTESQTVGPLPYHGMEGYPDPNGHDHPGGSEYLRRYQTREIADGGFHGSPDCVRPAR